MNALSAKDALSALAETARDTSQHVPSPCVSVCRMDPASGLCQGCFRTIDEIVAWGGLAEQQKRSVWHLVSRRAALQQNRTS